MNVSSLTRELGVSQYNVSKHLRVLRQAGIVAAKKKGTTVWCSIVPEFRQRLRGGGMSLDLGCCVFRFDRRLKS
jgi:DNA-binding transcriptional ArsR family regulator